MQQKKKRKETERLKHVCDLSHCEKNERKCKWIIDTYRLPMNLKHWKRCYTQKHNRIIDVYTYNNFCVTKSKFIMYNIQGNSVLYNNAVRRFICEGWHFPQMWKTLAWPYHFTKRGIFGHKASLAAPVSIAVPVLNHESDRSCICVLVVSIRPLSTIFIYDFGIVWYCFVFQFIIITRNDF